ncbi:unnamed protein product [Didymodactylos carnosus]|uniref:Uncharacterized protein n=1 Tax=Didymodactylos carnosus TaxID=1234261 RepID=A0A814QEV2_9BILA|nr:unnamed protein product [Didymodactylos carnosus]CAF1236490.1 unnamed protein product [Didymodactylos carnosus]CAF3882092.1 unnamed protein product [Didymodactylos carnosus]CAF4044055.1 unnamed protein product [Didymodactylos carnosus]
MLKFRHGISLRQQRHLAVPSCRLGVMRRFLIWPSEMVWPGNLPYIAILRTLHESEQPLSHRWCHLTRLNFFILFSTCQMIYYWLPGYIMPVLTAFSWLCMIKSDNILLSQLTGYNGFGIGSLQFDWYTLTSQLSSPIVVPRWAQINILVGFILIVWLFIPIIYYSNLWNLKLLPISNNYFYTPNGDYYQIDVNGTTTNEQIRGTVIYVVGYHLLFASFIALFIHTFIYHGKDIIKQFHTSLKNRQNDVHCQLMSYYREAPEWYYLIVFICSFITAAIVCHYGDLMPWYYLFIAMSIAFVCLLPVGIVLAISNLTINNVNIVTLIGGLLMPSNPIGNLTFTAFASGTFSQALILLFNFKFGHYMKISPFTIFIIQLVVTIVSTIIQYAMTNHLLNTIVDICVNNADWMCKNLDTTPILFALIDPRKMFGKDTIYAYMLWFLAIGAILPIFFWLLNKLYPNSKWLNYVHIPIMFSQLFLIIYIPIGLFPSWFIVGFLFHTIIRRWWFNRYALLFSIAMDTGVQISLFFLFFILINRNVQFPQWWGNNNDFCPFSYANFYGKF